MTFLKFSSQISQRVFLQHLNDLNEKRLKKYPNLERLQQHLLQFVTAQDQQEQEGMDQFEIAKKECAREENLKEINEGLVERWQEIQDKTHTIFKNLRDLKVIVEGSK